MKYVALSGGLDSTAMAILLHERDEEYELLFSDTGAELPETLWMVPRVARRLGKKLNVVANHSFFYYLSDYGFLLPSPMVRWCTRQLKQVPQDSFMARLGAEELCVGIRADEARRAVDRAPKRGSHHFTYPLVAAGIDRAAAKTLCLKYDLLSPVYSWRSNTSCFCCMFQRVADWRGLWKHHPDLFMLAEAWEEESIASQNSGFTWRRGRTLKALREATEAQLTLWPEPEDEPCSICVA